MSGKADKLKVIIFECNIEDEDKLNIYCECKDQYNKCYYLKHRVFE